MIRRIVPLLVPLAAAACVESPELGSSDQALSAPYCLESVGAVAPAPQPSPFYWLLPPNTIEQTWLFAPNASDQGATYSLYQVSAKTRVVSWRTTFPAVNKPLMLALTGTRPGSHVSIRFPPPPPPPPGDEWSVANQIVGLAAHFDAIGKIPFEQGPPPNLPPQ